MPRNSLEAARGIRQKDLGAVLGIPQNSSGVARVIRQKDLTPLQYPGFKTLLKIKLYSKPLQISEEKVI
tara:strand:+ start:827 stop:1033 length:207 start_codon:yes stop_codon:yes gene_type:complete